MSATGFASVAFTLFVAFVLDDVASRLPAQAGSLRQPPANRLRRRARGQV